MTFQSSIILKFIISWKFFLTTRVKKIIIIIIKRGVAKLDLYRFKSYGSVSKLYANSKVSFSTYLLPTKRNIMFLLGWHLPLHPATE